MTVEHIVGIDLGTTNSEIAVIEDGRPVVIPVEGEMVMPSCVGVDNDGGVIVGRAARNQMAVKPEATVLSIKRRMGEDDRVDLGDKRLTPEEVSALILEKLKAHAEDYLGETVSKAVITVPAYFDDSQRKATKQAGMLAGLEVLRIINEPTAAALAYESGREENMKILVYDLGGGTFDVSLVVVENGVVEVKASHGDTHLGGDDFDRLLIDHVMKDFKARHGIDLSADSRSWNRVWAAVERAKRVLSDQPYARIQEEFISGDHHLDMEVSRGEYEEMIRPLLRKTIDCVHRCLKDADFLPRSIDKIVLVGGATRTPLTAEMLLDEIGIDPRSEVNPELIVAMGAAIQGGVIAGRETQSVLVDITPYTFGTSVLAPYAGKLREDVFAPIIRRNTALPVNKGEVFQTVYDGQEAVDVRIYQGEEPIADDNIFIGRFLVEGLSDVPAGNEIVLNLQLNLDGILDVTAVEKRTGLSKTVRMDTGNGKKRFDLELARAELSEASEDLDRDVSPDISSAGIGDDRQRLVGEAKRLRVRAESLLEEVDETDAKEIRSLIEESKRAIGAGNLDKLSGLNESLSDMLFYLED